MAEIGDLWFDCAFCDDRITVPIRHAGGGKFTIDLAVDFGVLREHLTTMHPEHAHLAGEAVTGEQPPNPGELLHPGR